MLIPKARGAYSETLFTGMRAGELEAATRPPGLPESSEDLHIALWAMYELHYRGFEDVSPGLEWHPDLLRTRIELEQAFELTLRGRFSPTGCAGDFASDFFDFVANHEGASLTSYVQRYANRDEVLDLLRAKSIYHLKESDPTAWVVARLPVVAKAALVELLYDEYGGGNPNRVHSHLFAQGLTASGLTSTYGAYIDDASLEVLEDNNAMSLFGLNRRLRAAAVGHLAAFEATSSMPSRRMAQGLSRLGFPTRRH